MSVMGFVIILVLAAIAGGVGQTLAGHSIGGFWVSALLGLAGAWVGVWLKSQFGLPEPLPLTIDGYRFPLVWAILGSMGLVIVVSLIRRK